MSEQVPPDSPEDEVLAEFLRNAMVADGVKQEEGEEEEEVQVEKEADEATVKVEMKEEDWPGDEEFYDFPWEAEEDDQGQTFPGGRRRLPWRVKTRGTGATARHNSNARQNQRNINKMLKQKHGDSRGKGWHDKGWSSSSSQDYGQGWKATGWSAWSWSGHAAAPWDERDGWGGSSSATSSTVRLLEKALDKIPDASGR